MQVTFLESGLLAATLDHLLLTARACPTLIQDDKCCQNIVVGSFSVHTPKIPLVPQALNGVTQTHKSYLSPSAPICAQALALLATLAAAHSRKSGQAAGHSRPHFSAGRPASLPAPIQQRLTLFLASCTQQDDELRGQTFDVALQLQGLGWLQLADAESAPTTSRLTLLNAAVAALLRRTDRAALALLAALLGDGAALPVENVTLETLSSALVAALTAFDDPALLAAAASLCNKILSPHGAEALASDMAQRLLNHGVLSSGLLRLPVSAWFALRRLGCEEALAVLALLKEMLVTLTGTGIASVKDAAASQQLLTLLRHSLKTVVALISRAEFVGVSGTPAEQSLAATLLQVQTAVLAAVQQGAVSYNDMSAAAIELEEARTTLCGSISQALSRLTGETKVGVKVESSKRASNFQSHHTS